jgi:hypothetical protein
MKPLANNSTIGNQWYFSYIKAVSFIGGGNGVSWENHRPAASHWQTLSHNWCVHNCTRGENVDLTTKDHFRWVKVPGTAHYWKACGNTIESEWGCLQISSKGELC